MPPQPPNRFQNGPPSISPYTHQFPSHPSQSHQPPSLAQGYLNNPQLGAFGAANSLGLGSGMGANAGFGMGGDQTGLNSHAARMGFQQAAQLQQQQQHPHQQSHAMGGDHSTRQAGNRSRIRDVWRNNMDEEVDLLQELIDDYQYVAMVSNSSAMVECGRLTVHPSNRTQSSPVSSDGLWVTSSIRATTTTRHYG